MNRRRPSGALHRTVADVNAGGLPAGTRRRWAGKGAALLIVAAVASLAAGEEATPSVYLPDRSLTAAEYVALGMPSPDRNWAPSDYAAAVAVLRKVRSEDPARLPRYGSDNSGTVFDRLVAEGNLGVLTTGDAPAVGRLGIASDFFGSGKQVLLLYLEPSTSDVVFDDEIAEVFGFMLRLWAHFFRLLSDPTNARGPEAMEKAGAIIAAYLSSVLDSISDVASFRAAARSRLASHLGETLPSLWPALSTLQRADFKAHLERVRAAETATQPRQSLHETASVIGKLE